MCLLLETIKLENGKLANLEYHQQRFDWARQQYTEVQPLKLKEIIDIPEHAGKGLFRCRITYGKTIEKIEFIPYQFREIRSLKVVHDDSIDYTYKYADRSHLQKLFDQREDCDDIIIVKNEKVTDSFTGNLLFHDGSKWITPDQPLLKGTQRQYLLDTKQIIEKQLLFKDIFNYRVVGIINVFYTLNNMPVVKNIKIKK